MFSLVDKEDYFFLTGLDWYMNWRHMTLTTEIDGKTTSLARVVMAQHHHIGVDSRGRPLEIDHISGDRLDNRKSNLRICTHQQNLYNRLKGKSCSNEYKHIYPRRDGWYKIEVKPHRKYAKTIEEAIAIRDNLVQLVQGNYAPLKRVI